MSTCEPQWDNPIFIVGAPRSGTTLLRNMLNRHPEIAIYHESDFYHCVYKRRRVFGDLSDTRNRRRLVKEYLSIGRIQRSEMDLSGLAATLLLEGTSYQAFFAAMLRSYAQERGKRRCGEKTPRHALFAETLCQWYPKSKIIHILRDPRDVVASLLNMPWAGRNVLGNARSWLHSNLAASRCQLRPQYFMVRYEDLVCRPENELGRLCAFVGEEYCDAMLIPDEGPSGKQAWHQRAGEPVTRARIGKWREQLTADEAGLVEWFLGRHLETYGYAASGHVPSTAAIARDVAATVLQTARRHAGEFPAAWYSAVGSKQLAKEESAKERFRSRRSSGYSI